MTAAPVDPDQLDDPSGGDDPPLPERVDQLSNGLRVLSERIDEHEDTVAESIQELDAELTTLREDLDNLIEKESEPKQDPDPQRWATRATPEDWNALVSWVDGLRLTYSMQTSFTVPPCWPAHPGVVEELAGLYRGWVSAVLTDEQAALDGSSALTAWHDRWLWPALQRFKTASYRISNCAQKHVEETTQLPATDRTFLPPTSAMTTAKPKKAPPTDLASGVAPGR